MPSHSTSASVQCLFYEYLDQEQSYSVRYLDA